MSAGALRIPASPQRIYSVNEGNMASFPAFVQRFVEECKSGAKPYSLRYSGSMVGDIHRTLLYGGVFLYPATSAAPGGKLRLLYECNPMALLMEIAGGAAVTGLPSGTARILELQPSGPHSRSPIILGCKRDVERLSALLAESSAGASSFGSSSSSS
jgi:fructose-1,6-bisphosphatase I